MAKNTPAETETNTNETPVETSRKLTIAGVEFTASLPYAAGHVLTDVEAKVLNQTRIENLRNNFAPKVKASNEGKEGALSADQLQEAFSKFDSEYVFSSASAGGSSTALDPVEREALSIAKAYVKQALEARGQKLTAPREASDADKAAYKEKIDAKIAEVAQRPQIVEAAKAAVAERENRMKALTAEIEL